MHALLGLIVFAWHDWKVDYNRLHMIVRWIAVRYKEKWGRDYLENCNTVCSHIALHLFIALIPIRGWNGKFDVTVDKNTSAAHCAKIDSTLYFESWSSSSSFGFSSSFLSVLCNHQSRDNRKVGFGRIFFGNLHWKCSCDRAFWQTTFKSHMQHQMQKTYQSR